MSNEIKEEEFNALISQTYENEEAGIIETVQEINEWQYYFRGILVARYYDGKFFKC